MIRTIKNRFTLILKSYRHNKRRERANEAEIYQRIGEFVVCFQWLENRLREIGWFILDPERKEWPPTMLRTETAEALANKVAALFLEALPQCALPQRLEEDFRASMLANTDRFHALRRARNRILHSAYIELKGGDEVLAVLRSNPRFMKDRQTGEPAADQEFLSGQSFDAEMREMAELAFFYNRCYTQLIARYRADPESLTALER